MWVRFTKAFDWDPPELGGMVTQAYEPGQVANVRHECGEAAKAAGKAVDHAPEKDASASKATREADRLIDEALDTVMPAGTGAALAKS